jgi:hypothetical protein
MIADVDVTRKQAMALHREGITTGVAQFRQTRASGRGGLYNRLTPVS